MRRESIIIGLGILTILLALTGIGSSRSVYGGDCGFCHVTFTQPVNLTETGSYFKEIHRFNGTAVPTTADSCTECHVNPPTTDLNLTSTLNFCVFHQNMRIQYLPKLFFITEFSHNPIPAFDG